MRQLEHKSLLLYMDPLKARRLPLSPPPRTLCFQTPALYVCQLTEGLGDYGWGCVSVHAGDLMHIAHFTLCAEQSKIVDLLYMNRSPM